MLIKILRKNGKNIFFLTNYFNKFARKILCNMKILVVYTSKSYK